MYRFVQHIKCILFIYFQKITYICFKWIKILARSFQYSSAAYLPLPDGGPSLFANKQQKQTARAGINGQMEID